MKAIRTEIHFDDTRALTSNDHQSMVDGVRIGELTREIEARDMLISWLRQGIATMDDVPRRESYLARTYKDYLK